MSKHDNKCEALLWANNPNGMCWCHARSLAKSLSETEAALERETALLTEAKRQNADLMAIIDKRDEALGFIPLDKGMDMQDEILEAKGKLVQAVAIVRDLTRQITEFCEREGEADFYTGVAIEFLKKSEPCNHVWSKRLRGRDTCAICGVARPTDRIDAALTGVEPTKESGR